MLAGAFVWGQQDQARKNGIEAIATFFLHVVPTGAAIDHAMQGNKGEAVASAVGDIALGLGAFAKVTSGAKALWMARGAMAVEAGVGLYRSHQSVTFFADGDYAAGAGAAGEAVLRLFGVTAQSLKGLKKAGSGIEAGGDLAGTSPMGSHRSRVFAKATTTGSTHLPAGTGRTDKFGNVVYSTLGSAEDIALARFHESVHSVLSPKLNVLRTLRADIAIAGYERSSFLRYLEEALAETYAQVRVRGLAGLPTGIAFPVREGYVTLSSVIKEGLIGTIVAGGTTYGVYYAANR